LGVDKVVNHVNITNDMAQDHQKSTDATDIGLKLVGHAKSTEFSANRGLVIELFPFIFEASQRMSARAISRFLLEEQGVKLSAVTITKALNDPKKSWNAFFDTIEPSARILALWTKSKSYDYLFFSKEIYEEKTASGTKNPLGRIGIKLFRDTDILGADKAMLEKWFCISRETRMKAKPYLESRIAGGV
jgi:hypothetical protein